MTTASEQSADSLKGSGMIIINPPWKIEETLREALSDVHKALGATEGGVKIEWLSIP